MSEAPGLQAEFGRQSLWGSWQTRHTLADEVDIRVMAIRSGACTAALAMADVALLWPSLSLRFRQAIAAAMKIPPQNVGVFTTQNHAASIRCEFPWLDVEAFEDRCVKAATAAQAHMEEAHMGLVGCAPLPTTSFLPAGAMERLDLHLLVWLSHRSRQRPGRREPSSARCP